jgi:hypothetical protein
MANTRVVTARVPETLEERARASAPELAAVDLSTLVRVGLAVLAGHDRREAVTMVRGRRGQGQKITTEAAG